MDVFNRNGKILMEKLSSHVNGPEFDVTPYMTLCALDNMSGEFLNPLRTRGGTYLRCSSLGGRSS